MEHMIQVDYSALSDAQLDALIDGTNTHLLRLLTGAQSGTIGDSRAFTMARIGELQAVLTALSQEKRGRGDTVGDMFILGQFGQAGSGF